MLNKYFQKLVCVLSKNTFMNCIKKLFVRRNIRTKIRALRGIKALLLPILYLSIKPWLPASWPFALGRLIWELTQKFYEVKNLETITEEKQKESITRFFQTGWLTYLDEVFRYIK